MIDVMDRVIALATQIDELAGNYAIERGANMVLKI